MFVCPAGHLATRKALQVKKVNSNQENTYYFNVGKCKRCPFKKGSYKEVAK